MLLVYTAMPATAQDQTKPMVLEDFIPDSAVDSPEGWAADRDKNTVQDAPPDPDTPMDPLRELSVGWPDALSLTPVPQVTPDQDSRFSDDDTLPFVALLNGTVEQLSPQLEIAFPADPATFPMRAEFIQRFRTLSAITELSSDGENIAQLAARARADEALLADLLRIYGYYDAQITRNLRGAGAQGGNTAAGDPSVRFDIVPGARYVFGAITLGALHRAADFAALRNAFSIVSGDPLSSDRIMSSRSALIAALGEAGYPFAEIDEPELVIDHQRSSGDLTMPVRPKGKYNIAEVVSSDPDFLSNAHLSSIARFDIGDLYQDSLSTDLRRAIIATGLVSAVTATPRELAPPVAGQPGKVAMDIDLTKAKLRTIAGAIGYGAEEGYRLQASWEHRNVFPSEGALKIRGILGTREQLFGVKFRKNNFHGRDRILTLDAFFSTLDSDAFDAQSLALVGTYERASTLLFQKQMGWSAGFEIIGSRERAPAVNGIQQPRQTFYIGTLPVSFLFDTTDDLLNPTTGFRLGGKLSPEFSQSQSKESAYIRTQFDASYYQGINDRLVIAGRVRLGSIIGTSLDTIAPSRRYYAGGGSSVRGYGFQQIGPRDTIGAPSGGRSLVEAALEARIKTGLFDGALSFVPFIDAGSIAPNAAPDFDDIRFGAGLGIRYQSDLGPMRVDVGMPLNPRPNDSPVAVYVSLGQAF